MIHEGHASGLGDVLGHCIGQIEECEQLVQRAPLSVLGLLRQVLYLVAVRERLLQGQLVEPRGQRIGHLRRVHAFRLLDVLRGALSHVLQRPDGGLVAGVILVWAVQNFGHRLADVGQFPPRLVALQTDRPCPEAFELCLDEPQGVALQLFCLGPVVGAERLDKVRAALAGFLEHVVMLQGRRDGALQEPKARGMTPQVRGGSTEAHASMVRSNDTPWNHPWNPPNLRKAMLHAALRR